MYQLLIYIGIVLIYSVKSEEIPNNASSAAQAVSLTIPPNFRKEQGFGIQVELTKMDAATRLTEDTWDPEDFPELSAVLRIEVLANNTVRQINNISITASHLDKKPWFLNNSPTPVNQSVDICFENSLKEIKSNKISIQAYFSKPSVGDYSLHEDFKPTKVEIVPSQNCPILTEEDEITDEGINALQIVVPIIVVALIIVFLICIIVWLYGMLWMRLHRKKRPGRQQGSNDDIHFNEYNAVPSDVENPIIKKKSKLITKVILDANEAPLKEDLSTPEALPLMNPNLKDLQKKLTEINPENEKEFNTPPLLPSTNGNLTGLLKNTKENDDVNKIKDIDTVVKEEIAKKKEINILLLGQTGVGKSTYINGFANYLQFETLEEAEAHEGLISPVSAQFTITDEETFEVKTVITGTEDNESQLAVEGQSATQNPKEHIFPYGNMLVRIVDTPGIGDTRGIEQDNKNFKQILSFISKYDEIHGICILLKPNEARLDVMFRFCIEELLTRLGKSATANMVFCFTNARSTQYKPGDTMQPLKELLSKNGLTEDIRLRREILYCFDNEAFRYLAAVKKAGISFDEQDRDSFATSWKRSRATSEKMVNFFDSKPPHNVKNNVSMNEVI